VIAKKAKPTAVTAAKDKVVNKTAPTTSAGVVVKIVMQQKDWREDS
jgi:hypothetical protein